MTDKSTNLMDQLRRNRVALISLAVAIISMSYNTWRNEASEANRTQRLVSIEILLKLGRYDRVEASRTQALQNFFEDGNGCRSDRADPPDERHHAPLLEHRLRHARESATDPDTPIRMFVIRHGGIPNHPLEHPVE